MQRSKTMVYNKQFIIQINNLGWRLEFGDGVWSLEIGVWRWRLEFYSF